MKQKHVFNAEIKQVLGFLGTQHQWLKKWAGKSAFDKTYDNLWLHTKHKADDCNSKQNTKNKASL